MTRYCLLFLSLAIMACGAKKVQPVAQNLTDAQLFEKFRKQVVLIKNKSYFKVTFDNGEKLFYTRLDPEGYTQIYTNEQEAIDAAEMAYGTGFFIGKKGIIATNFHVVTGIDRLLNEYDFKKDLVTALHVQREHQLEDLSFDAALLKRYHPEDSAYLQKIPAAFIDPKHNNWIVDGEGDYDYDTTATAATLQSQMDSLLNISRKMEDLAVMKFTIEPVTITLSILLDAATGNTNEIPCHLYSLSQDKNVDLALIQTDDKSIPQGIGEITDLFNDPGNTYGSPLSASDTLKVTTPLYLIGYNYGPDIAQTAAGIKVQFARGEVTQENDQYRVMYSIPALPGSSGSPVFNKKGRLVAIHYSGYRTKENFNFGVHSWQLTRLSEADPATTLP